MHGPRFAKPRARHLAFPLAVRRRDNLSYPRMAAPAASPPADRKALWLVGVLLFAGTMLLFSRSLPYGFLNLDDPEFVTNNPHVQSGLTWSGVGWAFTGDGDYWRPLTWLSHMADWQLFGANATGHRTVSVAWHAANAVLVLLLFRRLGAGLALAGLAATLFAWHPLRIESVIWIAERKDVMSGFFFLLSVLAYLEHGRAGPAGVRPGRWYAVSLGAFVLGLMCKPSLVTLPLVLLALDFWPLGRLNPAAGRSAIFSLLREKLPFFALSALDAVVTIRMQQEAAAFVLNVGFADRASNAVVSVCRYLGKFVWPADLTLVYAHPGAWPVALVAAALAGCAGLTVFAWRQRRARPWILAGWIWFLAALLPMLGLLQVGMQAMADRYTYLALLGIELALLFSLRALPSRALAVAGAGLLAACTAATWYQQGFWRDTLTLYRRAVAVEESNGFAQGVLAYTCYENRLVDEAERHARRALELSPTNTWALLTLALIHEDRGENEAALACYTRLIAGDPGSVRAYAQRGGLYGRLGRLNEAAADFGRATQLDPRDASVWWAHAESLAAQEKYAEAAPSYARVLELQPDNAEAHVALGFALLTTGRRAEGTAHWREAVRLRPDFIGVRERLQRLEP